MTYVDRIRQNVVDAIDIRNFARKNKVRYPFAKTYAILAETMYSRDAAVEALKVAARFKLPLSLVEKLDLPTITKSIDWKDIYCAIGKYVHKEALESLAVWDSSIYSKYGKEIYNCYIKKGVPLDKAVKTFDKLIATNMKHEQVSEFVALASTLIFGDYEAARLFERARQDNSIKSSNVIAMVSEALVLYNETEVFNGITLVSKTKEGLKKLKDFVQSAYEIGKPETLEFISKVAEKTNLKITDFSISGTRTSCFNRSYNYVYIKNNQPTYNFFHEITHFLDWALGNNKDSYISNEEPEFQGFLNEIQEEKRIYVRGISLYRLKKYNEKRYIHNRALNRKWLTQIIMENPNSKGKIIRQFLLQKRLQERKKYRYFATDLQDIYDAISGGKLQSYFNTWGHGEYYSNVTARPKEFAATLGEFYNCGGEDILIHEFGFQLAKKMLESYKTYFTMENTKQIKSA